MPQLKLVIANKNISSWSMRPWVLLTEAGLPFEEELVPFGAPDWAARVGSPSGRVPLLIADGLRIWDSLAIAEYLHEQFPEKQLWPASPDARAVARAASSEMHSGFPDLRRECSMNLGARFQRELSAKAAADLRRLDALFADCRARFGSGGELLFGKFSIADAMFAPIAGRARTYGLVLSPTSQRYLDALWALPSLQRWDAEARAEVAAGIVEPVSHGALFSRAEAERFAQRWVDAWNAKDLDARLSLCAEAVRARGKGEQRGRASVRAAWEGEAERGQAVTLASSCWDGDVNRLALVLVEGGRQRVELLALDASARVVEIDSFER